MEISAEQLRSLIQTEVRAAVASETAKLEIQSGQNVSVTGAWPSFTVSATPVRGNLGGPPQGQSGGGGSGMPIGAEGDILYHDGSTWVVLAAPTAPADPIDDPVLRHDGTAPYWDEPDPC